MIFQAVRTVILKKGLSELNKSENPKNDAGKVPALETAGLAKCDVRDGFLPAGGEARVYLMLLANIAAFAAVRYFSGGLGALSAIALMAMNFAVALAASERRTWVASALMAYSYMMIFSYVLSNFYYIDAFNVMCFAASLALCAYAYAINSAFTAFIFLSFAQVAAMNVYFDYFNVNALFSGVAQMGEVILMPLIFIPFAVMAFYHKLRSETGWCMAHVTVLVSGLSFYLFIVNLEPAPGAVALVCAGFVLAFAAFILPSKGPSTADNSSDVETSGAPAPGEDAAAAEMAATASGGAMAVNIAFIAACVALYVFSAYRASAPAGVFEFYARGASLYYDDIAGYYARFNAPFASVPAGAFPEPQVYMRKNFMVAPGAPWKIIPDAPTPDAGSPAGPAPIRASALDVKTSAAGERSVTLDYPFLYAAVDEKKAAAVSPRFVYKVKAGVYADGGSALLDFSLAGDRFLMLDETSPYNKFNDPVREFFAVSGDGSMAAVYDFSGNVRIAAVEDGKTAMIISGLGSFKSVSPAGAAEFFILCRDALYKTRIAEKKLERVPAPARPGGEGYYGICGAGGKALLAAGPASAAVDAGATGVAAVQLDLNDSNRAVYFDGETVVCCDYFMQTVNIHKLKYSPAGYEIAGSLAFRTGADAVVRAAVRRGNSAGPGLAVCEYDPKTSVLKSYLIDAARPSFAGTFEAFIDGASPSRPLHDYAVFPESSGPPAFAAVFGDRVEIFRQGFFHDDEKTVFTGAEASPRPVPFLPMRLVPAGFQKAALAADNRLILIDVRNGEKLRVLEAAR